MACAESHDTSSVLWPIHEAITLRQAGTRTYHLWRRLSVLEEYAPNLGPRSSAPDLERQPLQLDPLGDEFDQTFDNEQVLA